MTYEPNFDDTEPGTGTRSAFGKRQSARRIVFRRMGVLAVAIAVPAMAAPQINAEPQPQVIRFAMPETLPYIPPPEEDAIAGELAPTTAPAPSYQPSPAANAFTLSGSFTSRMRAEHCLTMAIYYEAASESEAGQRAVAQVVMNRVQHSAWPNSVCGVVFEGSQRSTGCQFTFTCDGSLARRPQQSEWKRAGRVAREALGGYVYAPVGLATHYHTHAVNPYWAASLNPVGVVGAHRFYRWKGAAGERPAFNAVHSGYERAASAYVAAPRPAVEPRVSASVAASAPATPPAPRVTHAAIAQPAAPAAETPVLQLPGSVLEQHASSGQWLRDP